MVQQTATLSIDIPAGVSEGNYIPLHDQGDAGPNGGPPGDVIVLIQEEEHEIFERHGMDLLCHVPIAFWQAVLGDNIVLDTLEGKVKLSIPEGTQSGKILRLRGKGLPEVRGRERGDLLVVLEVETPLRLSSDERRIFEQLRDMQGQRQNKPKSFFKRARERFGI